MIKITLKAETARLIKNHQRINGVLSVPFAPKLRFRFEEEEMDPDEVGLAEALDRQMTKVTTTDDAKEIENNNGDEDMELLRADSGEQTPNSPTHLESEGLLSDSEDS